MTEGATIFVAVPSYRDSECRPTLEDCFSKAEHPERIYVGVFEQNEPQDTKRFDTLGGPMAQKYAKQISHAHIDASEAAGPVVARAFINMELRGDQDFVLSVDSHTLFNDNWDSLVLDQYEQCKAMGSQHPVITTYPEEYSRLDRRKLPAQTIPPSFMIFRQFNEKRGLPEYDRVRMHDLPTEPVPGMFVAAGFCFMDKATADVCPPDPHLRYVFLGEEINASARLWTHGRDLWIPTRHIVYHYTPRHYRPTFWEQFYKVDGRSKVSASVRNARKEEEKQALRRIHALLRGNTISAPYGLGEKRSLEDYEAYTGLDFKNQRWQQRARWGITPDTTQDQKIEMYGPGLIEHL